MASLSDPESLRHLAAFEAAVSRIGPDDPIQAIARESSEIYGPMRWALRHFLFEDAPDGLDALIARGLRLDWPIAFHLGTPLHEAALVGSPRCAKKLLSLGADPNVLNSEGEPPLALACLERHLPLMRLLRRHGALLPNDPAWSGSFWDPRKKIIGGAYNDFSGSGAEDISREMPSIAPCLLWAQIVGFPLDAPLQALNHPSRTLRLYASVPDWIADWEGFEPLGLWARSRIERAAARKATTLPQRRTRPSGL